MPQKYHILNGDALLERFPKTIQGERIVMREALIEGPVTFDSLPAFYSMRASYFKTTYGISEYMTYAAKEIVKIKAIPHDAEINLWFEDDLFCQTNFWFLMHLFEIKQFKNPIYLVRPPKLTHYGFGALNQQELINNIANKINISKEIKHFSHIWMAYSTNDLKALQSLAKKINFSFVKNAIEAHILSLEQPHSVEAPLGLTKLIIQENGSTDFGKVFSTFSKRAPIYGFGDLQYKAIWQKAIDAMK